VRVAEDGSIDPDVAPRNIGVYLLNPLELASIAVGGFGAMQKVPELAGLLDLVTTGCPRRILEIGFGNGGTAWCWSKLTSLEQLILVNLPNGPWGGSDDEKMLEHISGNTTAKIDYIAGNSQNAECLEAVEARLGGNLVDFLFIDGDHSRAGCLADYDLYRKFVRPGGLIAFHDICEHPEEAKCEVKEVWEILKDDFKPEDYCEFIAEPVTWGGIGVVKV
jgi:cephalosporin hydroxylase